MAEPEAEHVKMGIKKQEFDIAPNAGALTSFINNIQETIHTK